MSDPAEHHAYGAKCVLRYLKDTKNSWLRFGPVEGQDVWWYQKLRLRRHTKTERLKAEDKDLVIEKFCYEDLYKKED